jgi:hypothetical protein
MAPCTKYCEDGAAGFPGGGTVDRCGTSHEDTGAEVEFQSIFELIVYFPVEKVLIDFLNGENTDGVLLEGIEEFMEFREVV